MHPPRPHFVDKSIRLRGQAESDPMPLIPNFSMLGSGPSVLMLHDADTDHLGFAPQVELLASQGYRAIAWDMPGYHGNPPPYGGYSLAALSATADRLLEVMQIGRAHIVGHGVGAMVAADLALRYPTRVRSLTRVAGGPALGTAEQDHWVGTRQRLLAECQLQACTEAVQLQRFAEQLVQLQAGQTALPEGLHLARHAIAQIQPLAYGRVLDMLAGPNTVEGRLPHISQRSLLISGGQDVCMPPAAMQALADQLPNALHHALAGVGHWPQLENPEHFEALLLDFLAQQRATVH